jgi:hypothetical protein
LSASESNLIAYGRRGDIIESSLESESCTSWEAARIATFKPRGTFAFVVRQTQANRADFAGMRDRRIRAAVERARQVADRHEGMGQSTNLRSGNIN